MVRYMALIDGEAGAYGVVFPDLPGCNAMGETLDEALANAAQSLHDYVADALEQGESAAPRALEELRRDKEVAQALASGSSLANVALVMEGR
jgi:predicted RNase H-like HicB family nuclease